MPANFNTTPTSTTTLGTNQFPVSGVFVPGTASGDLTALQGGPATTDGNNYTSAPVAAYIADGGDVAQGTSTDAANANSVIGQLKQIKTNTASVTIGSLPAISGTVTANIGTTNGLALDSSVNGLLLAQGATTSGEKGPLIQAAVTTAAPTYTTAQTSPLSLTTAGALRTDASATTQPVSGTITANQGGTWNLNNISGTVSLPTGAATAAKQPALGTAGSASADVLTVQGIASMTALKVDGSGVTQPVSGTVTANAGTGTFTIQQTNITADYDTSAGTQNLTMFGLALPASGGAVAGGTSSNPVRTDPTGTTTQPVSGTVTANAGSGTFTVSASGNFNNASVGATAAAVPADATYLGANKSGNLVGLSLDTSGNLNVNVAAGGGSGGTSSSFSAAFPATGTAAGASDGTNMKPLLVDASGFLKVNVSAGGGSGGTSSSFGSAFPATGTAIGFSDGTNMQGARAFDADTGAGTQYVAGANLRISASGGSIEAKGSQTSANSIPVVIASDQGAVAVSGTITANIGTTNGLALDTSVNGLLLAQGSTTSGEKGPLVQGAVTTAAPSYTTAQTSPLSLTTAGALRVDGSGVTQPVSGTVTANAGSGTFTIQANASVNVNQIGGSAVSTAATGVQKVGIVGNAGATLDSTIGAGTAPTNALVTGAVYNTSAPAPTNGQAMAHQADQAGNLRTFPGIALLALSTWSSSTGSNASQTIFSNSGAPAVLLQLDQTTTLTGGAVTIEATYDGTNWVTPPANTILDPTSTSYAQIANPYTFQANTQKPFLISSNGWQALRIRLSTTITGTGTVTPNYALLSFDPVLASVVYSPTAANFQVTVGAALPAGGNTIGAVTQASGPWTSNITQFGGNAVATGTGAGGSGIPRVTVSSDSTVGANSATGSAVPANAFYGGGNAATSLPAAATAGNLTGEMVDKFGRQVVLLGAMRDLVNPITQLTLTATTSETTLIAAVASVFNDIVSLVVINTSATATQVDFRDSTAGTIRLSLYIPAGDTRGVALPVPLPQNAVNQNWTAKCGTSVSSIIITGSYIANK